MENLTRARPAVPDRLEAIIEELREADRAERIELLIDLAKELPPLPPRLPRLCGSSVCGTTCVSSAPAIADRR